MKVILMFAAALLAAALPARVAVAQADAYPSRPIRVIVPFAPGGSVDVTARLIAPKLSEKLGQQLVIENRAGASGIIGVEAVATARPDGYTLMLNTLPLVANQFLFPKAPYTVADLAPIALVSSAPAVVAVHPSLPVHNVRELLQMAKSKPGVLNYSAAGSGTNPHITGELFNMMGNVDITAIQYKGGGPALAALLAGEVGVSFNNMAEAAPHVKSGKLRALAITSVKRSSVFPDLPTVAESGIPGFEFVAWQGLLAPKGTPDPIIRLLNEKLRETMRAPDMTQRLEQMGLDNIAGTPDQFAALLKAESEKWGKVIKERNIRVE